MILSPIIFLLPVAVLSVPIDLDAPYNIKSFNIKTPKDYPGSCQLEYHFKDKKLNLLCYTKNEPTVQQKCMKSHIKQDNATVLFITGIDGKSFYKSYNDCPSFRSVFLKIEKIASGKLGITKIELEDYSMFPLYDDYKDFGLRTPLFNAIFRDRAESYYASLGYITTSLTCP